MSNSNNRDIENNNVIDNVLSTQPELGPKIPDGGYGWCVLIATLFFQIFIPSLIVVYGVLLASAKLNTDIDDKEILYLWDDKFTYVPLLFILSWNLFDPSSRNLISHSTWPRLIGQTGNCLTCAGLLFIWMGMAGNEKNNYISDKIYLILAGIFTGIGSSIQVSQCEILLAQYFKLKHLYVTHISHMFAAFGFIISPIMISNLRMKFNTLQIILIYVIIFLQTILITITFKKPEYLKSKLVHYQYVLENGEDEEDIFSKSLTELKVKTNDVLKRIEIRNNSIVQETPTTSSSSNGGDNDETTTRKNWIKFDEDTRKKNWEEFDEEDEVDSTTSKYTPTPIFNDIGVNNNTTYSFDDDNNIEDTGPKNSSSVFHENLKTSSITFNYKLYLKILKTPTFYKSLLTLITTKYSIFLFYALFPSYMYVQISHLKFKRSAFFVGCLSFGTLIFAGFSYWINVNKLKRPIILFVLCWIGANGYFLIATYKHSEFLVLFGALEIVLSIASLQHIGGPLLGLTLRGESNSEYAALSTLTGLSFVIFLLFDLSYRDCFLLMSLLHVITGLLWVSNYFYKKLRI